MKAELAIIMKKKGVEKVMQIVAKWPESIGHDEFAKQVGQQGLGLRVSRNEIDRLFRTIDGVSERSHGSGRCFC